MGHLSSRLDLCHKNVLLLSVKKNNICLSSKSFSSV